MAIDRRGPPAWTESERRHFLRCLAASGIIFLIYSIFSTGFLNPDEHFQTVEYASTKLGITDTADLPWEYGHRMRSWLQPAIYTGAAKLAAYLGVQRPTTLLLLFRLLTGLLYWAALWTLIAAGRRWIESETERRHLYSIAALLWLLPLLGVRTSSEAISTAALCFGIALLERRADEPNHRGSFGIAVLAGVALGLCFGFRFASGVMAAGAALWYLRAPERRLSLFLGLVLGAGLALGLNALADWWGYGTAVFPAYSYFYQNFVLGKASEFGTEPFFAYLYLPLNTPMAPLVFFLMLATFLVWLRRAGSALTWATAPYVALLCIAPHKEVRFLFPLAPFLPFFVILALAHEPPFASRLASALRNFANTDRLRLGYAWNACGLLSVFFLPLVPEFSLYQRLESESYATQGPIEVAFVRAPGTRLYWHSYSHLVFIEPKNLKLKSDPALAELEAKRSRGERFLTVIYSPQRLPQQAAWLRGSCALEWSSWPQWLLPYNYFRWQDRSHWLELYRC